MFNPYKIKEELRTALAWGSPCKESIGYTPDEFVALIRLALNRIKYLESVIEHAGIKYSQTDFIHSEKNYD